VPRATQPLAGRRVAVTRAQSAEDALTPALLALGAEVVEAPSIAIADPVSFADLDAALARLERFAWIAFASANAVDRVAARAAEIGVPRAALARPRLAAVGKATARRAANVLRPPDLVPVEASGAALAAAMAPHVRGVQVLVPRAEAGRPELVDGLTRAGAEVHAPVAYRTVPASRESLAPLAAALEARSVDAVLFASPSAVRSVVSALAENGTTLAGVVLGAIGPTTAAQLTALGLRVDVQPTVATGPALAAALAETLR